LQILQHFVTYKEKQGSSGNGRDIKMLTHLK